MARLVPLGRVAPPQFLAHLEVPVDPELAALLEEDHLLLHRSFSAAMAGNSTPTATPQSAPAPRSERKAKPHP